MPCYTKGRIIYRTPVPRNGECKLRELFIYASEIHLQASGEEKKPAGWTEQSGHFKLSNLRSKTWYNLMFDRTLIIQQN